MLLTFYDVMDAKFLGTKFEGYEQSEVDAFLDEIMRALRNYEARAVAEGRAPRCEPSRHSSRAAFHHPASPSPAFQLPIEVSLRFPRAG